MPSKTLSSPRQNAVQPFFGLGETQPYRVFESRKSTQNIEFLACSSTVALDSVNSSG